jgi:E3 SUMO-protein ligase PIAS1
MSLKDAASQVRIQLPCRGMNCTHFKCFDATTYLQMQEQAPLWTCPICDKPAPFGSLAVDE